MTNALAASLQGLSVGPVTLPTTPPPLRLQARSSPGAAMMQALWLPSAARQRALRSGFFSLGASLRSPLYFPRLPTTDRSPMSSLRLAGQSARFRLPFQQFPSAGEYSRTSILFPNLSIRNAEADEQNPLSARDQRAFRLASGAFGRPFHPPDHARSAHAPSALVTRHTNNAVACASVCGSAAGVALRLRFARRFTPLSAPLPPLADRRPKQ